MRKVLSLFLLTLSLPFLWHAYTLGFSPSKLLVELPLEPLLARPAPSEEVLSSLQQPFHFLSKGSQSYVFISEDGQCVLKLLRYNRSLFPFLHACKRWIHKNDPKRVKASRTDKLHKTLQSISLAYTHLPDTTHLLYVHLSPDTLPLPTLHLQDARGRSWKIPLSSYRFFLQKTATPIFPTLQQAIEKGESLEPYLRSFLHILHTRVARGIENHDPNVAQNFGFLGQEAIEVDVGNLHLSPPKPGEIEKFCHPVEEYLLLHAPDWHSYFLHLQKT